MGTWANVSQLELALAALLKCETLYLHLADQDTVSFQFFAVPSHKNWLLITESEKIIYFSHDRDWLQICVWYLYMHTHILFISPYNHFISITSIIMFPIWNPSQNLLEGYRVRLRLFMKQGNTWYQVICTKNVCWWRCQTWAETTLILNNIDDCLVVCEKHCSLILLELRGNNNSSITLSRHLTMH